MPDQSATVALRSRVYLETGETTPVDCVRFLNGVLIDEAINLDFAPGDPGYVTGDSVLTLGARDDDGHAQTSIPIRIAERPK